MIKQKIYVVIGSTGEYSDRTDWLVCAYHNKEEAKQHVLDAAKIAIEIEASRENKFGLNENEVNPYDPNMRMDYTGTSYYINECELVTSNIERTDIP